MIDPFEIGANRICLFGHRVERLAEIRNLQSGADSVRPSDRFWVGCIAQAKDQSTDGICRAAAIIEQLLVVLVGGYRLVLKERREQIFEGFDTKVVRLDCVLQGDEYRVK